MRNSAEQKDAIRAIEGEAPFTPARLLEIASKWEIVFKEMKASDAAHPKVSFSFAYHRQREALGVALYMERHGITESRNIGCFQLDFFKEGDVVTLPKGLVIGTTHPSLKGPVKRARAVKVHNVYEGYTADLENESRAIVADPKIEWVGSGGYWYWASIEDIVRGQAESTDSARVA